MFRILAWQASRGLNLARLQRTLGLEVTREIIPNRCSSLDLRPRKLRTVNVNVEHVYFALVYLSYFENTYYTSFQK